MADLVRSATWEDVYRLETTDLLEGGPGGIDNVQPQQLANSQEYLRRTNPWARNIADWLYPLSLAASITGWDFDNPLPPEFVDYPVWRNTGSGASALWCTVPALAPVRLTSVKAALQSDNLVPHDDLPEVMPALTLVELDGFAATYTNIATQVDDSPDKATYDALHVVTLSVSQVLDPAKQYAVRVRGESGDNSLAGSLVLRALSLSWDAPVF